MAAACRLVLENRLVPEGRGEYIGVDDAGPLWRELAERFRHQVDIARGLCGRQRDFDDTELPAKRVALGGRLA
jgi:hypothetical protein